MHACHFRGQELAKMRPRICVAVTAGMCSKGSEWATGAIKATIAKVLAKRPGNMYACCLRSCPHHTICCIPLPCIIPITMNTVIAKQTRIGKD